MTLGYDPRVLLSHQSHYPIYESSQILNISSHQCNICNINYDYITHLENSNEESSFLLRKMKIDNLTRVAGKYSWSPAGKDEIRWSTIPRNTTIQIYKHYFIDFGWYRSQWWCLVDFIFSVTFGYSPEMVKRFVEASNETLSRADPELRRKSYQNLSQLRKQFSKHNDNFFC